MIDGLALSRYTARKLMLGALVAMTVALSAPAGAGAVMTRFKPAVHGFHFTNSFSASVRLSFPFGIRTINLGDFQYGLCGGMTYSALDFFLAGKPIPQDTSPPPIGTPLYNYIYKRQLDTFTADTLSKFVTYPLRTDTDLTRRSRTAFNDVIRGSLDRGYPVPLGLIKTKGLDDILTGNHQVLAIGYSTRPVTIKTRTCFLGICVGKTKTRPDNEPIIAIYDPNFPKKTTYIQTNHNRETFDQAGTNWAGSHSRVRGYFALPLKPYPSIPLP